MVRSVIQMGALMVNTKDVLFYIEKYDKKLKSHFFEDWDVNVLPPL